MLTNVSYVSAIELNEKSDPGSQCRVTRSIDAQNFVASARGAILSISHTIGSIYLNITWLDGEQKCSSDAPICSR
jgi:hypothetical protein